MTKLEFYAEDIRMKVKLDAPAGAVRCRHEQLPCSAVSLEVHWEISE